MPKSGTARKQSNKLSVSTSMSEYSLDRARQNISKWEGERRELAEMALSDIALTLGADNPMFNGMFLKDSGGRVQAIAAYSLDVGNGMLKIERVASSGQRPGLGTAMMKELARTASSRGYGITLDATSASRGYYSKLGMEEFATDKFRWSPTKTRQFANS